MFHKTTHAIHAEQERQPAAHNAALHQDPAAPQSMADALAASPRLALQRAVDAHANKPASSAGGVVQMAKLWRQGNLVELLHDAHVGSGHLKVYVPDLADYVYVREEELHALPFKTGMPPSAESLAQAAAQDVPLYHVTAEKNLESIAQTGLQADRGGVGGFTDSAAEMGQNSQVQNERRAVSAGKVHLGSHGTASSYFSGFKLAQPHMELSKKKSAEVMTRLKSENPGAREFTLKARVKEEVDADLEVMASAAKLKEPRTVLVKHESLANARHYDADPHEAQQPATGSMAVRTGQDVTPQTLGIMTEQGEVPLLDDRAKRTWQHYEETKPKRVTAPSLDDEGTARLARFHEGIDKRAWEEEQAKKSMVAGPSVLPSSTVNSNNDEPVAKRPSDEL